jgi:hypothetical protein
MSELELAVIRRQVHPDLTIRVHLFKDGNFTYDEGHPIHDEGHFPQPSNGEGRWIHVPTNNMAHVAVSQFPFCRFNSIEDR